jgi:hypothetical protein
MEESPKELRSVVDFLNKQMERSEVLLVEARKYSRNGTRIVVPTLFGYTEEARQVKRSVTVTTAGSRRKWDKTTFFADARQKMAAADFQAVESFYGRCLEMGFEISWGTGKDNGSFAVKESAGVMKRRARAMTRGRNEDLRVTLAVLEGRRPPLNSDTTTWLGHATERDRPSGRRTDGQCGHIDLELLRGGSKSEIAERVGLATGTGCIVKRVEDHFKHLQESWNGEMEPHHLKLKEDCGKWSFDEEWIRRNAGDDPRE